MPENLLTLSQGLSESKLELANATAAQVMTGKTFYAGNKELKTGTLSLTGNATTYNVLYGNTFYSNSFTKQTGAMKNNGSWSYSINPGGKSVNIPAGYHNGGGYVSCIGSTVKKYTSHYTYQSATLDWSFTFPSGSTYSAAVVIIVGIGGSGTGDVLNCVNNPTAQGGTVSSRYIIDWNSGDFKGTAAAYWLITNIKPPCTIRCTSSNWQWAFAVHVLGIY